MKLSIYYDHETDTLSLWNGQPADEGADVAENLTVDLNSEGEAVGFTLEHAAELLKQVLTSSPKPVTEATHIEGTDLGDHFRAMFLSAMDIGGRVDSEDKASFGRGTMLLPADGSAVWYIASSGSIIQDEIIDNPIGGDFFPHMGTDAGYVAVAGDINQNVFDRLWQTAKAEYSPVLLLGMPGALPSLMEKDHDHPNRNPASQPDGDAAEDGLAQLHPGRDGFGDSRLLRRGG